MDIFPDSNMVRDMQTELDDIIQQGVFQITKLLKNSETATSRNNPDEDMFTISQKKSSYYKGKVVVGIFFLIPYEY
jgi:ATP-dependent RNA helicase SUPV3L1/SUV3